MNIYLHPLYFAIYLSVKLNTLLKYCHISNIITTLTNTCLSSIYHIRKYAIYSYMQPHPSLTSQEILTMASSLSKLKIKFFFSFINVIFILDVVNLKDIIEALKKGLFPNHHWSPLGLQLGLLQPTLSDIRAKYRDDPESCLQECLTLWLSKADKVTESGGPTWDSLADALHKIGENFATEKIMEFSEKLNDGYVMTVHLLFSSFIIEFSTPACQMLHKHTDRFSSLTLPMEIVQMLHAERVISK